MTSPEPGNGSKVADPKWKGLDEEYAIVVARGEPRRSNLQMEQAVAGQARRYLGQFTHKPPSDLVLALAVRLIAESYIDPQGSQGVTLTNKHLRLFVDKAAKQIGELVQDA